MSSRAAEKQRRREERLCREQLVRERARRARLLRLAGGSAVALVALAVLVAIRPWEQDPPPPFGYAEDGALARMTRAGVRQDAAAPHIHPKLVVQVRGDRVQVPGNMGLGASHAPMHPHESDGVAPGASAFKKQAVRPTLRLLDTEEVFLYYGTPARAPIT